MRESERGGEREWRSMKGKGVGRRKWRAGWGGEWEEEGERKKRFISLTTHHVHTSRPLPQ